jgi:hypothetical protein
MKLNHPPLCKLLQRAYSGERAAAFAYVGHAGSLRNREAKARVKQIEDDEWGHRENVLRIMQKYDIPINKYYEFRFYIIGKFISLSCYVIGWFMPYFFAGKLESGNVCEYFVMMHYFHSLGIKDHDEILYEMGMKEKEHEVYFLEQIKDSRLLPIFEKIFSWGSKSSLNDVDIDRKYSVEDSEQYCRTYKAHAGKSADFESNSEHQNGA